MPRRRTTRDSVFKAYDIRGKFGSELTLDAVYRIGRRLPAMTGANRALVGRDARLSSPDVADTLARGLADAGCDVDEVGLATTPMVYFLTVRGRYPLSVQVTASHNPPGDNGLKISLRKAVPMGYETGLQELEQRIAGDPPTKPAGRGTRRTVAGRGPFLSFLRRWQPDLASLRLAVDCSDGVAGLLARDLFGPDTFYLFDEPDGRFPHHAPNPLDPANAAALAATVRARRCDAGILFDGDGDRVVFLDERGRWVRPDLMIAVMARRFLRAEPGATILHDVRTSRGVIERLRADGGRPCMWKVGHAYAKVKMREVGAAFGGELAGHYYFRDFSWCDSGELAALVALGEIAAARRRGRTFSDLLRPVDVYPNSGEMNFKVTDKAAAVRAVRDLALRSGRTTGFHDFDGYRIEFPDWWISVRVSNTEPCVRAIVEARSRSLLNSWRTRVRRCLAPFAIPPRVAPRDRARR
jgi:phosphomannomutase